MRCFGSVAWGRADRSDKLGTGFAARSAGETSCREKRFSVWGEVALGLGTEDGIRQLLGAGVVSLQTTIREVVLRSPSPEHLPEFNRTYFGPTKVDHDALDEAGRAECTREFLGVPGRFNRAQDGTLVAPATYL